MRRWLITGVSSGLGRALAQAALARGDFVAGTLRSVVDKRAFELLTPDGRAHGILLDVTDEAAVPAAVAAVEKRGGIDILVNNAGYGLVGAIEEASLAQLRAQLEVNVIAPVAMMQAVLPYMRTRRRGHIVNVTSVSGLVGWPGLGLYSGSKFALEGISETLAQEVGEFGIGVTMVEPGGLRTDFAGRSCQQTAGSIEDYAQTAVGACQRLLADHAGHERGDPARAAQAILHALDADPPPLRLLLGLDALGYALGKLRSQQAEIGRWAEVSASIDYMP